MLYTEMVSAKAILYKNKNTNILLNIDKAEHPIAVQLFGSDPDIMAEIGAKVAEGPCDFIDINMGCPVPKIVNNHEGSYLLTQPKLVEEILTKMVKAIEKPVIIKVERALKTVKFRHLRLQNCGKLWRISNCRSRKNKGAVLQRKSRLGRD